MGLEGLVTTAQSPAAAREAERKMAAMRFFMFVILPQNATENWAA
jgi:hypothetical protein